MRNSAILDVIVCPRCRGALFGSTGLTCTNCDLQFPLIDGIPILINEENSLFHIEDFAQKRDTTYNTASPGWKKALRRFIPSIVLNIKSERNFQKSLALLCEMNPAPNLLVVGGAVEGEGFDAGSLPAEINLVETDVSFGPRTGLICDGHDLPFKDATFDGVIVQAVLEHVLDPARCVAEIERVLKKDGIVYAETPFMQQVHMGRFDFSRFTHLGHRRLFRNFSEIESGAVAGAGTALAWSYCYFLQSFFTNRTMQRIAFAFGSVTGFYLKYFDYLMIDKPGSFDSASCYYFIGKKAGAALDDRELIQGYRGSLQ